MSQRPWSGHTGYPSACWRRSTTKSSPGCSLSDGSNGSGDFAPPDHLGRSEMHRPKPEAYRKGERSFRERPDFTNVMQRSDRTRIAASKLFFPVWACEVWVFFQALQKMPYFFSDFTGNPKGNWPCSFLFRQTQTCMIFPWFQRESISLDIC